MQTLQHNLVTFADNKLWLEEHILEFLAYIDFLLFELFWDMKKAPRRMLINSSIIFLLFFHQLIIYCLLR